MWAKSLRLEDEDVRVEVGLRLGVAICEPHNHVCLWSPNRCQRQPRIVLLSRFRQNPSTQHHQRHIHCSLSKAGIPSIKEPPGLIRTDGRRPDGLTMILWRAGRNLVWDATVVDTLAPSCVQASATMAGSAAEIATEEKFQI